MFLTQTEGLVSFPRSEELPASKSFTPAISISSELNAVFMQMAYQECELTSLALPHLTLLRRLRLLPSRSPEHAASDHQHEGPHCTNTEDALVQLQD